MRPPTRAGMRKAKVALARKLAAVLHRMLANGVNFRPDKLAPAAAHYQRNFQDRAVREASRPEQGPVAGTMHQVGPMSSQQGFAIQTLDDFL
jgi:hypothetical protein